ncbi:MAG: alpha-galactosidase [Salinivirgaceae bacterium]|jgi:alpha-galactosidase|nr:alpha-galactosidase [Salinivirgaceae bacterium]
MVKIRILISLIFFSILFGCSPQPKVENIENGKLHIELSINKNGVPYIAEVKANDTPTSYFTDLSLGEVLQNRLSNNLLKGHATVKPLSGWELSEDSIFIKAKASVLVNDCAFTMHVNLAKELPVFTVYNTVQGKSEIEIKEFPVFGTELSFSDSSRVVNWWKALDYTPQKEPITSDTHLSLNSLVHSSDNYRNVTGNVPYWTVESPSSFMGFSLAWCGGWRASLNGKRGVLACDVYLQEEETQLKLASGETVKGPEISIFCSPVSDPVTARKSWMGARSNLASRLYPTPKMGIPFIYNHWYSVRSNLSSEFIKNQVKWFDEYGFDVFMIDDGWYRYTGAWTSSTSKFEPGKFDDAIQTVHQDGSMVGLWSCPQYIRAKEPFPEHIDQPGVYSRNFKSWLVDYNAMDFNNFMVKHLDTLENQGANWWKYDQIFFSENPRSGKMKSVNAFQDGFIAARKSHPKMIFEACQGGGKMINEFTDQISQIHWIRDGNRTGYVHALANIHEALGAVGFLEPQKVQRWTNRIDETEMKTPDLLKFYCRSCMIGTWGISTDLYKISNAQRKIILEEVKNYRRINEIKKDKLIDFNFPGEYVSLVPVVFYSNDYTKAAVLLYSLTPNEKQVKFKIKTKLIDDNNYEFYDVDANKRVTVKGNTVEVSLRPGQSSGIFFIDKSAAN